MANKEELLARLQEEKQSDSKRYFLNDQRR